MFENFVIVCFRFNCFFVYVEKIFYFYLDDFYGQEIECGVFYFRFCFDCVVCQDVIVQMVIFQFMFVGMFFVVNFIIVYCDYLIEVQQGGEKDLVCVVGINKEVYDFFVFVCGMFFLCFQYFF